MVLFLAACTTPSPGNQAYTLFPSPSPIPSPGPNCEEYFFSVDPFIQTDIPLTPDLKIVLTRGPDGWGSFVPYQITIHGDGKVIYDHPDSPEPIEFTISSQQLQDIVKAFEEANFLAISNGCNGIVETVEDAPTLGIQVSTGINSFDLLDEGACATDGSFRMCRLADTIERILDLPSLEGFSILDCTLELLSKERTGATFDFIYTSDGGGLAIIDEPRISCEEVKKQDCQPEVSTVRCGGTKNLYTIQQKWDKCEVVGKDELVWESQEPCTSSESRMIYANILGDWSAGQVFGLNGRDSLITGTLTLKGNMYIFKPSQQVYDPSMKDNLGFLFAHPVGKVVLTYSQGVFPDANIDDFKPGDDLAKITFLVDSQVMGEFTIRLRNKKLLDFYQPDGNNSFWTALKSIPP